MFYLFEIFKNNLLTVETFRRIFVMWVIINEAGKTPLCLRSQVIQKCKFRVQTAENSRGWKYV